MPEKIVERVEDMSAVGTLQLIQQDDGDIIVSVSEDASGLRGPYASVEFCLPGSGGGHSPRTHAALRALMEAMEADRNDKPDSMNPETEAQAAAIDSAIIEVFRRLSDTERVAVYGAHWTQWPAYLVARVRARAAEIVTPEQTWHSRHQRAEDLSSYSAGRWQDAAQANASLQRRVEELGQEVAVECERRRKAIAERDREREIAKALKRKLDDTAA
jgi:hypothetical protein